MSKDQKWQNIRVNPGAQSVHGKVSMYETHMPQWYVQMEQTRPTHAANRIRTRLHGEDPQSTHRSEITDALTRRAKLTPHATFTGTSSTTAPNYVPFERASPRQRMDISIYSSSDGRAIQDLTRHEQTRNPDKRFPSRPGIQPTCSVRSSPANPTPE
ncbi:hypothetical protein BDV95DRAFT_212913 [Massariosphaeria phaeospora]|uniref:Uncharacterized protein n=1 Tax=Massariosphaeria phaeospora TaxID=100035 RepID=A0A7C8I750_9PLEO|nr:hypothetical protein BDV95DRAFT_212913 [Massariosphaeria phaeospora]